MLFNLRLIAGGAGLAAGLAALTTASAADLPPAAAKKAAAADAAALQEKLEALVAEPGKNRGATRTVRALALTLAAYGDAGKAGTGKVLAAMKGKAPDAKAALAAAKALADGKADALDGGYDLEDVMSPFRVAKSGGLNIEKDIKDDLAFAKNGKQGKKLAPADAEVLGARSAALAEYTAKLPPDDAKADPKQAKAWEKLSKDMAAAGKDLAEEGGKGDKADVKKVTAAVAKLDASCVNCHNQFRKE